MATANVTTLAGQLNSQFWNDYNYGDSVDAATGDLMDVAVEQFRISEWPVKTSIEKYYYVQTQEDYDLLVTAKAKADYNTGDAQASGSLSFMLNVSYSETSLTIVALSEVVSSGYGSPPSYALTTQAQKVVDQAPKKFRETYGDYFVANAIVGARFVATYTCSASSSQSLSDFKTAVSGASGPLTASGAAGLQQSMSKYNISVNIAVDMYGVSGSPPSVDTTTPQGILNALVWFKKNYAGIPLYARLVHYSQIDNRIPNTLPIDSNNFSLIQNLGFNLQQIEASLRSLPHYYQTAPYQEQQTYGAALYLLQRQFSNSKSSLPIDPQHIQSLTKKCQELFAALQKPLAVYNFYLGLNSLATTEPGIGKGSANSITYGCNSSMVAGVNVEAVHLNHKQQKHVGHRTYTFNWPWSPYDSNQVVVGWYMHNVWGPDGHNGRWTQKSSPIIGTSSAEISIRSDYDRGFDWTCYIYYVDISTFPWLSAGS